MNAHTVVAGRLVAEQSETEAAQLEKQAAKLMQRARDIRTALARIAAIHEPRPPCCIECDSPEGDVHYGWCSFNGSEAFTVVS
jgi:hypothetical protein